MKISLVQCSLLMGDVEKNYEIIRENIEKAVLENPDVIVLPEMWNTSFSFSNAKSMADKEGIRTKEFLKSISEKYKVNIVGGSVSNIIDDKLYNTSYVFNTKAELVASYNKAHLFSPAGEDRFFSSGNEICVFEINGVKCGLCICYDLRFPEWIRMTAIQGIDILFLPSAWPVERLSHWLILNRARAIENQIFVACVNSTGFANKVKFVGNSSIIDPWGEYVAKLDDEDGICTGQIDLSIIEKIRKSINVFNDRKQGMYSL